MFFFLSFCLYAVDFVARSVFAFCFMQTVSLFYHSLISIYYLQFFSRSKTGFDEIEIIFQNFRIIIDNRSLRKRVGSVFLILLGVFFVVIVLHECGVNVPMSCIKLKSLLRTLEPSNLAYSPLYRVYINWALYGVNVYLSVYIQLIYTHDWSHLRHCVRTQTQKTVFVYGTDTIYNTHIHAHMLHTHCV